MPRAKYFSDKTSVPATTRTLCCKETPEQPAPFALEDGRAYIYILRRKTEETGWLRHKVKYKEITFISGKHILIFRERFKPDFKMS